MQFYYHDADHDILVIKADGGLNSQTATQFVSELATLVDGGIKKIVVDCANLDFISSYGLGVLVRLHGRLHDRGGDVKLCNVKGVVAKAFQATRIAEFFEIYPDVERARLMFRPPEKLN